MRRLFAAVALLCVATILGANINSQYGQAYGQNGLTKRYKAYGNNRYGHDTGRRLHDSHASAGNRYYIDGGHYAGREGKQAYQAHQNNNRLGATANNYVQKAILASNQAQNAAAHNNNARYHDDVQAASKRMDNAAASGAISNFNRQYHYRNGDLNHDNVNYGFNKKYNHQANEDGDYVLNDHSDHRSLDDERLHQDAANGRIGDHADNKYNAKTAHANRDSKYGHNAARNHYHNGKHGADAGRHSKYSRADAARGSNYGHNAGSRKYYDQAHAGNRNRYDNYAARNAAYNRAAVATALQKGFQYQPIQYGGYGQRNGNGGYNYGNVGHKYGQAGYANHDAHRAGRYGARQDDYLRNNAAAAFNENKYNLANANIYNRAGDAAAHNNAYHQDGAASAAGLSGFGHNAANAHSRNGDGAANHDLYKDKHVANNLNRVYHDRANNHKVYKKFHHSSNVGGNTYENLHYNRRNNNDHFGNQAHGQNAIAKKYHQNVHNATLAASAHQNDRIVQNHANNAYRHNNYRHAQAANVGHRNYDHNDHAAGARGYNNDKAANNHRISQYKNAANNQRLNDFVQHHYGGIANSYNSGAAVVNKQAKSLRYATAPRTYGINSYAGVPKGYGYANYP